MYYAHPTLLLPGIGGGSASLLPLQRCLRKNGIFAKRFIAPPILFHSASHYAENARRAIARLADRTGRKVTVFGWSLGGLYGVLGLDEQRTALQVRRFIAFGTPYDGTLAGHLGFPFRFLKGARDVLPDSAALRRARMLINDVTRPWEMIALHGKLDLLAPYPPRSIRPDMAVGVYVTHTGPFFSRSLQRLIAAHILRP